MQHCVFFFKQGVEETGNLVAKSQLGADDCRQVAGLVSNLCSTSYMGKSLRELETPKECEFAMHHSKSDGGMSVSGTGNDHRTFSESGIDQDCCLPQIIEEFAHLGKSNEPQSSLTWSEEPADCVVEDSEEADSMHGSSKLVLSSKRCDSVEIINLESVELQASKRPRLVPPEGGRRLFC